MKGAFPPSSIEVRRTRSADMRKSARPTWVDPVNESLRRRWSDRSGPVSPADLVVGTTLTAPAGTPASMSTAARAREVSGVSADGLRTLAHPAAMASASLRVAIARGKFHGVMNKHGPTGRRISSRRARPSGAVLNLPSIRTASSENHLRNSAP